MITKGDFFRKSASQGFALTALAVATGLPLVVEAGDAFLRDWTVIENDVFKARSSPLDPSILHPPLSSPLPTAPLPPPSDLFYFSPGAIKIFFFKFFRMIST